MDDDDEPTIDWPGRHVLSGEVMGAANAQIVEALRSFGRPVGGVRVQVLWRSTIDSVRTFEVRVWSRDRPSDSRAQAVRDRLAASGVLGPNVSLE